MEIDSEGLSLQGRSVVIVEDDTTLRELLADIIGELGGQCSAFANAEDALIHLLENHGACSLIIADHGVPGSIKGTEFLNMVAEKWPGLPAILTSGWKIDRVCNDPLPIFLFKPWSMSELIQAIKQALGT